MATSPAPQHFQFPWQEQYQTALTELNDAKLKERIREAEEVLLARLCLLTSRQEDGAELELVEGALRSLAFLKRNRKEKHG